MHRNADADAIGSSLGLYHYLIKKRHDVSVITPDSYPEFLHWMPGNDNVTIFDKETEKARQIVEQATVIFCLDFNGLGRLLKLSEPVEKSKATKILIDHHRQPEDFTDHVFCYPEASSTAELVFQFIESLDDNDLFDKNAADCLYAGMMTDSGSFRFPTTSAETHRIVGELIKLGVDVAAVYRKIYENYTENQLRLTGYALNEKLQYFSEYNTALIALSKKELQRFNFKRGDTEGLVNYGLTIKGVRMACLMLEFKDDVKLSFRSKGSFSVNDFSRNHFNGGGHINAAGGELGQSLKETVEKFIELLPEYKGELTS